MKSPPRTYLIGALLALAGLAGAGSFAQTQAPSGAPPAPSPPQVPGGCNAPDVSPQRSQAENDLRTQAYLMCLEEQQRNTRAIDDGLRRSNPPPSNRWSDPTDRRSGDARDMNRR